MGIFAFISIVLLGGIWFFVDQVKFDQRKATVAREADYASLFFMDNNKSNDIFIFEELMENNRCGFSG
jgi:hypothetical protein